jgi:diguanylate cyclase (GGDEF)-like protein
VSRAQTLVLALLVLNLLLGTLSLVVGRGEHRSAALRWWGWGLLTYAAGLFTTVAASIGWISPIVAGFVGNSLVSIAPALCMIAIVSHTHYRAPAWLIVPGIAITMAVLAWGNFADSNRLLVNLIAPTPIAVILFVIAAWVIARRGPVDARAACQFLAGISVLSVATWVARVVVMLALLGGTQDKERIDIVISLFAIMQMVNSVGAALSLMWIDVRLMQAELSRVAHTDHLTGLPNRRGVMLRFDEALARATRHGRPFALAVFDLDHFKQVNDRHGHAAGDAVLRAAGGTFANAKRAEDVLGRVGGEEFLVLFADQPIDAALEAAERLRQAIARTEVTHEGRGIPLTVSGGIAMYPDDGKDWDALFGAADRRLYGAKESGRNRVEWRDIDSLKVSTA